MKLYKITIKIDGEPQHSPTYVSSNDTAAAECERLLELGIHRKEITTEPIDVPTDKKGLIEFLNAL